VAAWTWFGAIGAGVLFIVSAADPVAAGAAPTRLYANPSRYPFAGYITSPATITSSAATVVVPSFACSRKLAGMTGDATVYDSSGPGFSSAMVYLGCSRKKELVAAIAQIDNAFSAPTVTMNPGDSVVLSATCGASGIAIFYRRHDDGVDRHSIVIDA